MPQIPIEIEVMESIQSILDSDKDPVDIAIDLCLYCMRTQIFIDGNKRAAVIYANQYLIAHGQGFIAIPEKDFSDDKTYFYNLGLYSNFDHIGVCCFRNRRSRCQSL